MQADFSLGVSIFKREDETLPEYLMSFSPMAPFFGVKYRFAPVFGLKTDEAKDAPVASAKPRPKRRTPGAKLIEAVAEPAIAAAPAPMAEAAVAAVDAAADLAEAAETPLAAAAAAMVPDASPAEVETAAEPTAAEAGKPAMLYGSRPDAVDDLKLIKGVGPKLEKELNGLGLYTFAQIATLTPENLAWVDDNLSSIKGRSLRDDWVGQAAALLEG
jgi:predicted flap endonuclease-1-like 5' DNA nuclease